MLSIFWIDLFIFKNNLGFNIKSKTMVNSTASNPKNLWQTFFCFMEINLIKQQKNA